jgi:hypothetical protein
MRAATAGHAAVVDHGHLRRRDLLADQAGERGGLLAIEVGFEAVADSFVQQDAGPAGAEDDFHLAGGSVDRSKLQDGRACGFAGKVLGRFVALEEVERDASAAAAGAARGAGRVLGDHCNVQPSERLGVGGIGSVGGSNQDAAQLVIDRRANLGDAHIVVAGGLVGALDELELVGDFRVAVTPVTG